MITEKLIGAMPAVAALGTFVTLQEFSPPNFSAQAVAITCAVLTYMVIDLRGEVRRLRKDRGHILNLVQYNSGQVAILCERMNIKHEPPKDPFLPAND